MIPRKHIRLAVLVLCVALPTGAFAATQTFDDTTADSYGQALALEELTFHSENGTWLAVNGQGSADGTGTSHSLPNRLSVCGAEPRSAGQRTGITARFGIPAKSADFWLTGTFHDTVITAYDRNNNPLAATVQSYPQTGPLAPDGSAWDVYYDKELRHVQVAAPGIARVHVLPSEYDCFAVDDFCYEPDGDPAQPPLALVPAGYAFEVLSPDLITHTGLAGSAHDDEDNFYFPGRVAGETGGAVFRILPTGATELFARINPVYQLKDLSFDREGDMILVLRALGCPAAGTPPLALVRVTGFEGEPSNEPVATPAISPAGGTFTASVAVTLSTSTSGADIRYTLDGSAPTALSALYTGPVPVTASATLKAKGFKPNHPDSAVASAVFTIQPPPPQPLTIPALNTAGRSSAWKVAGTELFCWNSGNWLEYSVDFGSGGTRTLGVTATNENNASAPNLPAGFSFALSVQVDGANKGTLQVPGSTTAYRTGTLAVSVPSGTHTVRFTWTNDAWTSGLYDANIRVKEISAAP